MLGVLSLIIVIQEHVEMFNVDVWRNNLQPWAPLSLRAVLGAVFIAHGLDKLFGTFGGGGFSATTQQFGELGLQPAWFHAALGGGGELLGGSLVLMGLCTRFGALLIAATMLVAIVTVHGANGLFARDGGFEYPLVALAGALTLMLHGGGHWALETWLATRLQPGR
jgi:putative oxidoreductase